MLDALVNFLVFGSGVVVGLGFANRIYAAKSRLYMDQINSALDSTGIKRTEFLDHVSATKELELRVRRLEVRR